MMTSATLGPAPDSGHNEYRNTASTPLKLIEIERNTVVNTVKNDEFEADGVYSAGAMRELCPHCRTHHLRLILRQKRVCQSHLFCEICERCFDARFLDGTSALTMD